MIPVIKTFKKSIKINKQNKTMSLDKIFDLTFSLVRYLYKINPKNIFNGIDIKELKPEYDELDAIDANTTNIENISNIKNSFFIFWR